MSSSDAPEIFGLNQNVNLLYLTKYTDQLLDSLKMVLPKVTNEALFRLQRNTVKNLLSQVHEIVKDEFAVPKSKGDSNLDFNDLIDLFALTEIDRLVQLTHFLANATRDLQMALEGKIMMSELQ